jgi:eukaryotic-like serine/threonine-protein kinase
MDLLQTLGKYEIRGILGRGAMGTVYDGWDPLIARRVAIKTVPLPNEPDAETADEIARFRREAQAAGRLSHPGIVAIYDYGETNDVAYIVMEFVDGPTLKTLLGRDERFALPDVARIMGDLLSALQFSHDNGVVHRDIKPANVMLTKDGRAKIADFGIARIEQSSMTQAGTLLGTPAYMSPEQFMGQTIDARTDVYSSGALFYQLLTGERPYEGGLTAIMHKVLNTEPPVPSAISVTTPKALDAVVARAMAKRPDDRFSNAAAFAAAIRAALAPQAATPFPAEPEEEATMVRAPGPASVEATAPASVEATAPASVEATMVRGTEPPAVADATVIRSSTTTAQQEPEPTQDLASSPASGPAAPTATPEPAPPSSTAAAKSSRLPMLAGAAVVLVALAGGASWFVLRPAPSAVPGTGPVAATLPPASKPATSEQATAAATIAAPPPVASSAASSPPPDSPTKPAPAAAAIAPVAPQPAPAQPAPAQAAPTQAAPAKAAAVQEAPAQSPPTSAPPPMPVQTAANDIAALRRRITQSSCMLAQATLQDSGGLAITGLAGIPSLAALRQDVPNGLDVQWQIRGLDPAFCPALDVLRPVTPLAGLPSLGLALGLADDQTTLHDGDRILPHLTMADFAGELRVDYVGHDGSIVHLYPTLADTAHRVSAQTPHRFAPGEQISLGAGGPNKPEWEVGPPYGTDMIIAVASAAPLHVKVLHNAEDDGSIYLHDLGAALQEARQDGGKVTGTAILVETLPKAVR